MKQCKVRKYSLMAMRSNWQTDEHNKWAALIRKGITDFKDIAQAIVTKTED